jgi:hypothetical protein
MQIQYSVKGAACFPVQHHKVGRWAAMAADAPASDSITFSGATCYVVSEHTTRFP